MANFDLADDGFVEVTITPASGEAVTKRLDLYEVYLRLMDASRKTASDSDWYAKGKALLADLGFPEVSIGLVRRFVDRIMAEVNARKKPDGGEPKQDSPDSTGPQPSPSPAA